MPRRSFTSRAVVLDNDVSLLDEFLQNGNTVRLLEVQRDAALVAVQVLENQAAAARTAKSPRLPSTAAGISIASTTFAPQSAN